MNVRDKALQLRLDEKELDRFQALIDKYPERVTKSTIRALNRAGQGIVTDTKRAVSKEYTVTSKVIKEYSDYKIRKAKSTELEYEVQIGRKGRARRIPLILAKHYPRGVRRGKNAPPIGLTVEWKKGQKYKIPGSFTADTPVRGLNIFSRQHERASQRAHGREHIYKLVGQSVAQMISGNIADKAMENARTRFDKEFRHNMEKGHKYGGSK
ncbi:phage tail protein [Limisalsivibrio acetivorans]|uniref:phage tail protein n=1 Tax=Limisalsivibrio acetivorans TaxID=1304888 RepID=UPI0003B4ED8F|nr:phage tail protein [Limisalsivibrio acetivorans]